jgi:hypothetical protein
MSNQKEIPENGRPMRTPSLDASQLSLPAGAGSLGGNHRTGCNNVGGVSEK